MLGAIWNDESPDINSGGFNKQGLDIYRRNLLANAQRALSITFPTVFELLGSSVSKNLVYQFLRLSPPSQGDWSQWGEDFPQFISTIEENGKSKLFTEYGLSEIFAGGQNNLDATHHAIIGAVDMVSLVNGLDELFSSQEFKLFASKVAGNREVISKKTVFRLASFN